MAARFGAKVCHVDASKGMVQWARENATINGLEKSTYTMDCRGCDALCKKRSTKGASL